MARGRYTPYHEKARALIERELKLINHLKLSGYFLIVWDIVRFCREKGIVLGLGRCRLVPFSRAEQSNNLIDSH